MLPSGMPPKPSGSGKSGKKGFAGLYGSAGSAKKKAKSKKPGHGGPGAKWDAKTTTSRAPSMGGASTGSASGSSRVKRPSAAKPKGAVGTGKSRAAWSAKKTTKKRK